MTDNTASAPTCDLLVRADVVVTQNETRDIIDQGGVAIDRGLIVTVGDYASLEAQFTPTSRLDLSGKMLMPGLVNGHTHLPMTLLRGLADDLPLMDWLEQHIWPVEFQLTEEMLEIGAMIGCAELIRTGCTSYLNGYFHEHVTGNVTSRCGLRAVLGEGFFSFPSPFFPTPDACWDTIRDLHTQFDSNPLIRTSVAPHAVFTVNPDEMVASFAVAEELDIPWQIHLAESKTETAICLEKHGKRPVELLDSLQLLSSRTTVHHCVDVTDEEVALLADSGTKVVHNPASNFKLCSGMAPVQAMLDRGVTIGLGTDGAASNNQLNMFRDMGLAALGGKVRHGDASAVNAQSTLDMATRGSAQCLGWEGLGRLETGCPADLIALEMSAPNFLPAYNPVSHIVYASTGSEVCMTMVAGEILYLYDDFKTMDYSSLRQEANRACQWIRSKAKK